MTRPLLHLHSHHHGSGSSLTTGRRDGEALVALAGNPNSGKTTIFNQLTGSHQKVGNWGGVTVERRDGWVKSNGRLLRIVDLPGMYSLSAVSPDEEVARDFIVHGFGAEGRPDIVVQVVDGGRLERSLLLTVQLIEQELPLVLVLNMFDEVRRRNLLIDPKRLSEQLGIPVVPTVGNRGEGIRQLVETLADRLDDSRDGALHIAFDDATEATLAGIRQLCADTGRPIGRGYAIGLLTREPSAPRGIDAGLMKRIEAEIERRQPRIGRTFTEAVTHTRYTAISKLLAESVSSTADHREGLTARIDRVMLDPWLGIPIFLALMFGLFQLTFTVGAVPMDWIDGLMSGLGEMVKGGVPGLWGEVLGDGIIGGAGMILVFLPNILILMMGIHLFEDSGYMARAAFLMDRLMRLMGLHGKAFIPLLMGFGCNVPALMASRTLESRRDRLLTMLLTPFMSCSARLPVYVIVTAAFFPRTGGTIIFTLYLAGLMAALLLGRLFSRTLLKGQSAPFVMELPPYRWPTGRTTWNLLRFNTKMFLRRIGTLVAAFAVLIWFLSNFPRAAVAPDPVEDGVETAYAESTYIYRMAGWAEPVFEPLGFTLKMDIALISGFVAKEIVVATMGVLMTGDSEAEEATLVQALQREVPSPAAALAFLVFVLLYTPCLTTVVTLQREARAWQWTAFSVAYQTGVAYLAAWGTLVVARGLGMG